MKKALVLGCVLAAATALGAKHTKKAQPAAKPQGPVPALSGVVRFEGTAPAAKEIDKSTDPNCGANTKDAAVSVQDGKLANVVVRVMGAPVPAGANKGGQVVVEQKQCEYTPRVSVAMDGQQVVVKNADGTLHNVHAYSQGNGTKKTRFNKAQTPGSAPIAQAYDSDEGVLSLKCDIHPWMQAWVVPVDNPYYAVTGPDGSFTIKDLPPGTYTVEAWHESLGTRTQKVTVPAGGGAKADFSFGAK